MRDDFTNARGQQLLPDWDDWDASPAQRFFVHIVSCIFYARGSFPESCFRCISNEQWEHPEVTHEHLLNSGEPLSSSKSLKDYVLSQKGPFIYPRHSNNGRLARFLESLHGIFAAMQQRRLGRYRICLSRSKSQDPDALIELYDLTFRYTEGGSLFVSVAWGGARDNIIPTGCQNPFNEFLRTRGSITGTFYTHPFIYSNNSEPLNENVDPGLGKFLERAVPLLQGRPNSDGGRIGTLAYHAEADNTRKIARARLNETKFGHQRASPAEQRKASVQYIRQAMPVIHRGHLTQDARRQSPAWGGSPKPRSTMKPLFMEQPQHEDPHRRMGSTNDILSVYEEASDQLPSTQLLSSPQLPKKLLKRPRQSFPNHQHQHSSSSFNLFKRPSKRRPGGRSIRSSSGDSVPLLDASQLQPPSSASGSTHRFAPASATSYNTRIFDSTAQRIKPQ